MVYIRMSAFTMENKKTDDKMMMNDYDQPMLLKMNKSSHPDVIITTLVYDILDSLS